MPAARVEKSRRYARAVASVNRAQYVGLLAMSTPLRLRPAGPADYAHYARLFPELETGDATFSEEKWHATVRPQMLLVESGPDVAGYAYVRVLDGMAYVTHVVVAPGFRGRGVGRFLMDHIAAELRAQGVGRWELNVKPDNVAAIRLYEAVGMRKAGEGVAVRFDWTLVATLPEAPSGLVARAFPAAEDRALEAALAFVPGQLADARRRGALPFVAEDPSGPRGALCFDPSFPGCFPVRVRQLAALRPLLEALLPHALADKPHVQMFIEDNEPLAALLLERGGAVRLRTMHMAGSLDPA